jgi:hypothetical protein
MGDGEAVNSDRVGTDHAGGSRQGNRPDYGETWVYESIVGAIPGVKISAPLAVAIQFSLFETAVLALAWTYELWAAAIAGTAAVTVATAGSVGMLRIGQLVRRADPPEEYRHLLFGSSIEVVLSVVSYVALVTYLFVVDPGTAGPSLIGELFGTTPPAAPVFVMLLVLWDLCYRIGTGWWACVVGLWRSVWTTVDGEQRRLLWRADLETMGFALLQLALVPFLWDHPVLLVAVVGHVGAVLTVGTLSVVLLGKGTS